MKNLISVDRNLLDDSLPYSTIPRQRHPKRMTPAQVAATRERRKAATAARIARSVARAEKAAQ